MHVRVLGSAGSEGPGLNLSAFLIDDFLLLDSGTVALSLDRQAQCRITHIFLTHAHLDHIRGIPFLVDNLVSMDRPREVLVLGGREAIAALRKNIFNNQIWPDFTTIPDKDNPVLRYQAISTRKPVVVGNYRVQAVRVNHVVASYGYIVEDGADALLVYTGDTGPTTAIWKRVGSRRVNALIIEVSFPNELSELALATGHLTPALLEGEMRKMERIPDTIFVSHLKPAYRARIESQLAKIAGADLEVLSDGKTFTI